MNWKTLEEAALITCGVFVCFIFSFTLVVHFPWTLIIFVFVSMLYIIYKLLERDYLDSDDENEEEMK